MAKAWEQVGERGGWSSCFPRQFNDWELDKVKIFVQKLQLLSIKREVDDKLSWNESKSRKFSIRSFILPYIGDKETFSC